MRCGEEGVKSHEVSLFPRAIRVAVAVTVAFPVAVGIGLGRSRGLVWVVWAVFGVDADVDVGSVTATGRNCAGKGSKIEGGVPRYY